MKNVTHLLSAADAVVPRISLGEARRWIANENALLLDVREAEELVERGQAEGAVHVPRGMLEFRADPESPFHDVRLARDRIVILFCAAGVRSALAGLTLREMGYARVYNLGAFDEWGQRLAAG